MVAVVIARRGAVERSGQPHGSAEEGLFVGPPPLLYGDGRGHGDRPSARVGTAKDSFTGG